MAKNNQYKSAREVIGFNDTWTLIIGIPLVSFLVPLIFFNASLSDGLVAYLPKWLISFMYTLSYWILTRAFIIYIRQRLPQYNQSIKRIIFTVASIILCFIIVNIVMDVVQICLDIHEHPPGITDFDYHASSFTILLLVSTLYESVYIYYRWKKSILEAEQLRRENVESQLEGLKNQVNPHFLFNSLNTLAYIIPENPERGVKFVQKLSKVYRYILEIRNQQLIILNEELNFLNAYNFLLKERFGENLNITLDIPEDVRSYKIVPLSLQILFENAIKHNIISSEDPLWIEAWVETDRLFVRNNLQRKPQVMNSTRLGLQNIKNRYAFFTNEAVTITETNTHFIVSLPLILLTENVEVAV